MYCQCCWRCSGVRFHIMPGPIIPGPPPHGQFGQGVVAVGGVVVGVELSTARAAGLAIKPIAVSAAAAWKNVNAFWSVMAVSPVSVYR
jgi:hypothetical protein